MKKQEKNDNSRKFTYYRPGMKGWMVERASVVELNHGKVEIIGAEVQGVQEKYSKSIHMSPFPSLTQ